jgi:hypothetical protein
MYWLSCLFTLSILSLIYSPPQFHILPSPNFSFLPHRAPSWYHCSPCTLATCCVAAPQRRQHSSPSFPHRSPPHCLSHVIAPPMAISPLRSPHGSSCSTTVRPTVPILVATHPLILFSAAPPMWPPRWLLPLLPCFVLLGEDYMFLAPRADRSPQPPLSAHPIVRPPSYVPSTPLPCQSVLYHICLKYFHVS